MLNECKQRLIDVWCGLEQSIFDQALTSGEKDFGRVSVPKDTSSTACELMLSIICYIQCELFIASLITKIMPATFANTFLFILRDSALADLGVWVLDFRF